MRIVTDYNNLSHKYFTYCGESEGENFITSLTSNFVINHICYQSIKLDLYFCALAQTYFPDSDIIREHLVHVLYSTLRDIKSI